MNEQQALDKAKEILRRDDQRELSVEDGKELLALSPFIKGNKFGDIVSAFHAAAPIDVVVSMEKND